MFLLSSVGLGCALYAVSLDGPSAAPTRTVSIANGLIVAVSPSPESTHILYLTDGRQPALWRAEISAGRLTEQRELIPNAQLQAISW